MLSVHTDHQNHQIQKQLPPHLPTLVSRLPKYASSNQPSRTMITDRHGNKVPLSFDRITERNAELAVGLKRVNLTLITERVINDRGSDMTTADLDLLSIGACEDLQVKDDPEYLVLASAIAWSNLIKSTPATFGESVELAIAADIVNPEWASFCTIHRAELEHMMTEECLKEVHDPTHLRDIYSYLAYNMLTGTYLLKVEQNDPLTHRKMRRMNDGSTFETKKTFRIIERPSYALMRIAVQLHMPNLHEIERCVKHYYGRSVCPATPVWQYAGGKRPCLASCNLYSVEDSLEGLQKSWLQTSTISARGGGLGGTMSRLRTKNSIIHTSQGLTTSAVGWCEVLEVIARRVNQGGKRAGSNAVYFDIVHGDILDLINLKSPNADKGDIRCPDLHTAVWCCDAFFARLEYQVQHENETIYWPTFNPAEFPELIDLWGPRKTARIEELERQERYVERVPIMKIWNSYLVAVGDKGEPYLSNGCTVNAKSNHINLGTITSSNLCCEIVQFHDHDSVAVCILSSVCLPASITTVEVNNTVTYGFSFQQLSLDVRQLVRNLLATSIRGYQSINECKVNNDMARAIAIGVQGLAETFAAYHFPFESDEAFKLNQLIFEHMYYYALLESNELVKTYGYYPGWDHVGPNGEIPPLKRGIFHWQQTGVQPAPMRTQYDSCANADGASPGITPITYSDRGGVIEYRPDPVLERGRRTVRIEWEPLDWESLRYAVRTQGVANSMLIGLMPTMSTSKIMGWTDSFEPSENICSFKNNATSDSVQIFKPLWEDLHKLSLYSEETFTHIKLNAGSIQNLDLPVDVSWMKKVYPTVYEVDPRTMLRLAIARQAFVDQAMSQNVYFKIATKALLTTWHLEAWRGGLKTGQYYARSWPAAHGANVGTSGTKVGGSGAPLVIRKSTTASSGFNSSGSSSKSTVVKITPRKTTVPKPVIESAPKPTESVEEESLCSIEARKKGIDCATCFG